MFMHYIPLSMHKTDVQKSLKKMTITLSTWTWKFKIMENWWVGIVVHSYGGGAF